MPTFMCSFLAATPAPSCSLCPLWLFSVLSVLNSEKLNTVVTKNHREIDVSLSVFGSSASPPGPQCSLWLFSVLSVLNSEKLNTEATKNHREIGVELLITTRASGANLSPRFGGCRGPSSLRRVPRRPRERLLRPGSGSRLSRWPSRAFLDRLT